MRFSRRKYTIEIPPTAGNALIPRDFRARALSVFSHGKMGAKKRASNTPSAGEKKVKKYVECLTQTEDVKAAEGNSNNLDALRKDPTRLEAMSVKELKAVMKDAGINAKGRKQDLISALGCFLKQNDDGAPSNTTNDLPVKDVTHAITSEKDIFGPRKTKGVARSQMRHCKHHEEHSGTVMKEHTHVEQVAEIEVAGSQDISLSAISEPWTILAHKKPEPGWVSYNPKTMRPPVLSGGTKSVKLISWNVNGLRALLRSGGLEVVRRENFDVLCLQETKMQEKDVDQIKDRLIDGYDNSFWTCSVSKLGYSGTAVISRIKPVSVKYGLGVQDHDGEGRLLTVEFETFYLLCAYVPNSGEGLRRLTYRIAEWDTSLSNYMKDLEKTKPVVLTGDLNCAHEEIDIYNPAGNRRSAGFTDEERQSFEKNFLSRGFVDTFRRQHPGVVGYTYWGFRHGGRKTNRGWRLDYFLVSESIAGKVHDSYILPDVVGSDHCPIGLVLKV